MQLDRTDLNILLTLQSQGRISNKDLADAVALSPSSCLVRLRKLESEGVIESYHAHVNLKTVCRSITCFASIVMKNHDSKEFEDFENLIADIPEVVECFTVSGSFDFLMKIVCPDMESYLDLNNRLVNSGIKIENVSSHLVMKNNKRFSGYPLKALL